MTVQDSQATRTHDARTRPPARARPFRAIDGEAIANKYVCMTSSTGRTTEDLDGLPTGECLNFILREGRTAPSSILVAFGWNYDVNMILRDVAREQLVELWDAGAVTIETHGRSYALEWIPGKLFSVRTDGAYAKLYDVFGFFQSSFVKALQTWGLGEREFIAEMKEHRGDFDAAEMPTIVRYSIEECELLAELMERVRHALHAVELKPRTWLGAGAIASTLLSKYAVQEHRGGDGDPPALRDTFLRAYFGGRTEVFQQGVHELAVSWDINSAYPAAALDLPTAHGTWTRRRAYDPDATFAVWRVRWKIPRDELLAPFPFRNKRAIYYPNEGEGYYHAIEVQAARALYGDAIEVTSGYVFEPVDGTRPFAFLADVYAHRQELKAEDHPGEKVLKLGINSVYGKLAQGNSRDGKRPKFQSYFWAGYITAATRARVLLAAAEAREGLVAIATDGIVFAPSGPKLDAGKGLGAWERTRYRRFFVAQPGMFHATDRATNSLIRHSRGFFTKEIDFPKLKRLWKARGPVATLPCPSHRFVGLGSALMRKDFDVWRTWEDGERRVSLYLAPRKRYADLEPEPTKRLFPPDQIRGGLSDVYVPKRSVVELDPDAEEWVQGNEQPMRVF